MGMMMLGLGLVQGLGAGMACRCLLPPDGSLLCLEVGAAMLSQGIPTPTPTPTPSPTPSLPPRPWKSRCCRCQ
jgi:hypothetical protein